MNEEEIIEIIEKLQCEYKEQQNNDYTVFKAKEYSKGLQGLLDLYNAEKEKNKVLQENCIPKSKVKELAKKYEFALNDYDSSTADYKHSQNIGKYIVCIELLKEGE